MIKVKKKRTGLCEVELDGELTIYEATDLKNELFKKMEKCKGVTINLSNVSEIDTSCFQILILAKRECDEGGIEFTMNSHSPAVLDVIETFNMGSFFGDPIVL
ncbi:MAG: STAS domain-containing protein [Gammaproteobacteria bacterium]|nr:STAS domain-containing protein [Gammaproteobacteria bacterium]